MARLNLTLWLLWGVAMTARQDRGRFRWEWVALIMRTALPIAPNLSDTVATLQGGDHWLHLVATMAA